MHETFMPFTPTNDTDYDEPYATCPFEGCGVAIVGINAADEDIATKNVSMLLAEHWGTHTAGVERCHDHDPDGHRTAPTPGTVALHLGLNGPLHSPTLARLVPTLDRLGACLHQDGDRWGDSAMDSWGERDPINQDPTAPVHVTIYVSPLMAASVAYAARQVLGDCIVKGPRWTDAADWSAPASEWEADVDGSLVTLPVGPLRVERDNLDLVADLLDDFVTGGADLLPDGIAIGRGKSRVLIPVGYTVLFVHGGGIFGYPPR